MKKEGSASEYKKEAEGRNQTENKGDSENFMKPKISYCDMVMENGFGKLNPQEIVEMVSEDLVMDSSIDDEAPFDPKPNIDVSLEKYDEWCRPWKLSLIVMPLRKTFNLQALDRWVQKRWVKKGVIQVMGLAGNVFLVRFMDQDDYAHALFEGPWMIADHYLLVQRWRSLFLPHETDIQKVAVWVRIPNLPAKLYNKFFLWKVGKALRTILKVDELPPYTLE
ncbi:uncharacterized protein LOC130945353 [Arachis stenosperma]|uniref:uncharacterized protein LOC130945353 n=1 Tax=Arachis stenosperma TaxID=217475 RepID=UPI0025ABF98E|nr:uncharacterized protein LOC130945353 [Arachis stenosperma]